MQDNRDKTILEEKIKKIDEQIALLSNLKIQYLTKLQSFSQIAVSQPTPLIIAPSPDDKIALVAKIMQRESLMLAWCKVWIYLMELMIGFLITVLSSLMNVIMWELFRLKKY